MKPDQVGYIVNERIYPDMFQFMNCHILIMHLDDERCQSSCLIVNAIEGQSMAILNSSISQTNSAVNFPFGGVSITVCDGSGVTKVSVTSVIVETLLVMSVTSVGKTRGETPYFKVL